MFRIVLKSIWNRRFSVFLTISAITVGLFLILSIDKVRREAKASFVHTISDTDLIVGTKAGQINILLYTIFQIGSPVGSISYSTYSEIASWPEFAWTVPISLGDSHQGFRVIGTSTDYFNHYHYGDKKSLTFMEGGGDFSDIYNVILGYEVAKTLNYKIGDTLVISHGMIVTALSDHEDKPFRVVGILDETGTPVDRGLYVSLEGLEAIHVDWRAGIRLPLTIDAETAKKFNLTPKIVTAFLGGLENRATAFKVQKRINDYRGEALEAIIPGVTLSYLWQSIGNFENLLLFISVLVLLSGVISLLAIQLAVVNERRREMAVFRAVGAGPKEIFFFFIIESFFIMIISIGISVVLLYGFLFILKDFLASQYGLYVLLSPPDYLQFIILSSALILGLLFSLIPALISYRQSLKEGLTVRL